jgi:hypothetical protein
MASLSVLVFVHPAGFDGERIRSNDKMNNNWGMRMILQSILHAFQPARNLI